MILKTQNQIFQEHNGQKLYSQVKKIQNQMVGDVLNWVNFLPFIYIFLLSVKEFVAMTRT